MATTFVEYTGDGQASKQFTFPSYQESDVKVRVDGVLKTTSTHYNITGYTTTGGGNVVFTSGNIPSSPANIRIYRDTNVDTAKATFTAGSSVKAADLNNNNTQLLYRAQEEQIPNLIHSYDIDDGAVTAAKFAADSVTSDKIADNSINSEHYVDGSIDTAHIADAQITTAKLADNAVTTAKIPDDAITGPKLGNDCVDGHNIQDNSINSEHYIDGSIDRVHLEADIINGDKLADNAVGTEHIQNNAVTTAKIVDSNVTTAKIANLNVTTDKLANSAVTNAKLANNAVQTGNIVDNAVQTAKIQDSQVTTSKIADAAVTAVKIATNAVTTDKIADGELTTLAGMQSGTASKLADSTALTADIADLNQIDGMAKQTTITDDDTKFPTSGAVVDYVAAQLEPFGGFEAIANESSFPNTQPVSGVAISIADAGGMSVSNSGTASGATVGGTTVNISGIPSNFHSSTVAAGIRFIVTSTGSGQNYTYHKATLKEDDLINLSGDINDFSERYRVGSSNPTTSLDSGDLFFNTGTGKLLVYNGTNSAWEEAQSVGNFFINTLSSSSATGGGSATPNGTAYRFTLSNAGTVAQQHIVSVDGVIQKPNSGTSQPSEGFAIDGADIIFGSAPVSGASIFVVTSGSTVNIGTPSNNTVTTAILQNGSVTTAKITDANVTTAKIADQAVTLAKLEHGTSNNDGKFLRANNGADPTFETVDLSSKLSLAGGTMTGTLYAFGGIELASYDEIIFDSDSSNTYKIKFKGPLSLTKDSSYTLPEDGSNGQFLKTNGSGVLSFDTVNTDLVSDTSPQLGGDLQSNGNDIDFADDDKAIFGTGGDLEIYHDGSHSYIKNNNGDLILRDDTIDLKAFSTTDTYISCVNGGAVTLRYDNSVKLATTSTGIDVTGRLTTDSITIQDDGSSEPLLHLRADDSSPWAFVIGNDSYHSGTTSGIKYYVTNTGSAYQTIQGNSSFLPFSLQQTDGSTTNTGIKLNTSRGVELNYQGQTKLHTTADGIILNGASDISHSSADNLQVGTGSGSNGITIYSASDSNASVYFADGGSGNAAYRGFIEYSHSSDFMSFGSGGITAAYFDNSGHFLPVSNNSKNLGSSSKRWANLYTNDLHLSNKGHSNDMDGSWGDWTIQEGESDLFLKNNRSGKKYKFNLTEVS